jgi:uncharacterized protein YkwD
VTSRLVNLFLLTIVITLFSFGSLSGTNLAVASAHALQQTPGLELQHPRPTLHHYEVVSTKNPPEPIAPLTNTNVTTSYIFLPIVFRQPLPDFVIRLINATNSYRTQYGCPAVTLSQQLSSAAESHSQDMALHDFFSHTGSDGSSPWQRIAATGYEYWSAAENIAAGYTTPEAVVQAWMSSGGHRDNILNCALREIGVGYYYLENDTGSVNYHHYWTQILATPK